MTSPGFEPVDVRLADFLAGIASAERDAVRNAVLLLSRAVRLGDVCLPLSKCGGGDIASALWASGVVGKPGDPLPLILDRNGRLYFHRFRRYEERVACFLREGAFEAGGPIDHGKLDAGLSRLFRPAEGAVPDRQQREAAAKAVLKRVSVVSGGPGTGKTTTVVKILALLLGQAGEYFPDIALVAPTGKAAARLKEAIARSVGTLDVDLRILERIPREAVTIHRLLGATPGVGFRHGPENPLPYDVVVVDEASMIALPLMARLVDAIPKGGRLILLGDKDQLASVEEGAVFADLCDATGPFSDCVSVLTRNYRFISDRPGNDSPIAFLSSEVREGKGAEALVRLRVGNGGDAIGWADLPSPQEMERFLRPRVLSGFSRFLESVEKGLPEMALEAFGQFRILSAHREGTYGVSGLNEAVERILFREGKIRRASTGYYPGRPVLVLKNDHALRLYNGETGVILRDREDGKLKAFFPPADDAGRGKKGGGGTAFRTVLLPRLPEHETAWSTTVHKSQGAEFDDVLLILGPSESGLVTRELVYTGITRARKRVFISSSPDGFTSAVASGVKRHSGLCDLLSRPVGTSR